MNTKEISALFLLAALWGASFLFMRITSPVIGPVLTIELRVLIAGLVLLLYVWMFKKKHRAESLLEAISHRRGA